MGVQKKQALDWMQGTKFEIGDIVTRMGDDLHRIIDINSAGDLMLVECIRPDKGVVIDDDGTRSAPCYQIGDQEWNLPRRYSHPQFKMIEGEAAHRQAYGIADPGKTRLLSHAELTPDQVVTVMVSSRLGPAYQRGVDTYMADLLSETGGAA